MMKAVRCSKPGCGRVADRKDTRSVVFPDGTVVTVRATLCNRAGGCGTQRLHRQTMRIEDLGETKKGYVTGAELLHPSEVQRQQRVTVRVRVRGAR